MAAAADPLLGIPLAGFLLEYPSIFCFVSPDLLSEPSASFSSGNNLSNQPLALCRLLWNQDRQPGGSIISAWSTPQRLFALGAAQDLLQRVRKRKQEEIQRYEDKEQSREMRKLLEWLRRGSIELSVESVELGMVAL